MAEDLTLAAEFPPTDAAEWRKLVEAALRGADFDKRLVNQTYDGLRLDPLYARAAGAKPVAGRHAGAPWIVMQRVDHPDPAAANAQALEDLQNGAGGLTLVFAGSLNANGYGLAANSIFFLFKEAARGRRGQHREITRTDCRRMDAFRIALSAQDELLFAVCAEFVKVLLLRLPVNESGWRNRRIFDSTIENRFGHPDQAV